MAHFLLIHGACHGGWCWRRVLPLLEAAGHTVDAPDLPGHGADETPMSALSLDLYCAAVAERALSSAEPVVLVGHSMAGAVISRVAEQVPKAIAQLVYLTAYLPRSGQTLASLARRDTEALTEAVRIDVKGTDCVSISADAARRAFYQDADDETFAYALDRIGPEPVCIFRDKAKFTAARFGSVSRAYIHCTLDKAIGFELQKEMVAALPCDPVLMLSSGHSPFLTAPKALVAHLCALVE